MTAPSRTGAGASLGEAIAAHMMAQGEAMAQELAEAAQVQARAMLLRGVPVQDVERFVSVASGMAHVLVSAGALYECFAIAGQDGPGDRRSSPRRRSRSTTQAPAPTGTD